MLKVFRDGLALDMSLIVSIRTREYNVDQEDFNYFVEARLCNGDLEILEWFETKEDADAYIRKIVEDINYWES